MKKNFILTSIALVVLLVAGLGVHYILSLHTITFSLQDDVSNITIYSSSDKEIKQLTESGELLLKNGAYYAIPEGDNIAKDKIAFSVEGKDKQITITPAYSAEYLSSQVSKEKSSVEAAIRKKYPSVFDTYSLTESTLYARGEWFGGLLAPKVDARDQRDPYRIVLLKKDGQWEVIRRPEYVLTSSRYSEVPVDILKKINQIVP